MIEPTKAVLPETEARTPDDTDCVKARLTYSAEMSQTKVPGLVDHVVEKICKGEIKSGDAPMNPKQAVRLRDLCDKTGEEFDAALTER